MSWLCCQIRSLYINADNILTYLLKKSSVRLCRYSPYSCWTKVATFIFKSNMRDKQYTSYTFCWTFFRNDHFRWKIFVMLFTEPINFYFTISICRTNKMSTKWISSCCILGLCKNLWRRYYKWHKWSSKVIYVYMYGNVQCGGLLHIDLFAANHQNSNVFSLSMHEWMSNTHNLGIVLGNIMVVWPNNIAYMQNNFLLHMYLIHGLMYEYYFFFINSLIR